MSDSGCGRDDKVMLRGLTQTKRGVLRVLEAAVVGLLGALVLDVLWQVTSRYVVRSPSAWTDELATLLVIWLALLGASAAFGRQAHLGVDFVVNELSPVWRRRTELVVHAVVAAFAVVVLIVGGLHLVRLAWLTGQVSPALGVNMAHVYLALPISGGLILLFALEAFIRTWVSGPNPADGGCR